MKKIYTLSILFFLTACASSNLHLTDPQAARDGVKCTYDDFAKTTTCRAPFVREEDKGILGTGLAKTTWSMQLAAITEDNKPTRLGIAGSVTSPALFFADRAIDNDGVRLPVIRGDSRVLFCNPRGGGCTHDESFVIEISKAWLTKHADKGIAVKVYGKGQTVVYNLPPAYIQGFLKFLEQKGR